MADIQLAVDGKEAVEATKRLLDMPEISGDWQPVGETQSACPDLDVERGFLLGSWSNAWC